jgi:cobalt-zinc-cadmium efflux system protein
MAHDHAPPSDLGPAFRWAVGLNVAYVAIEAAAAALTGSLALFADAAHNLTDVAGLLIAWFAASLANRSGTMSFTWGLGRATILAAMLNATAILIGVGIVIWEAAFRLTTPVEIPGLTVMIVALLGIGVNAGSALLFMKSRKGDLNAKGAFLHMATDAGVSGAVVLAAGGIMLTNWQWLDSATAIAVSVVIAFSAWGLMREALELFLDGVPSGVDRKAIAAWIGAQSGVAGVHDLHIWALSTTRTALAAHVVRTGEDQDDFIDYVADELEQEFGINHVTLQIESYPCERAQQCLVE